VPSLQKAEEYKKFLQNMDELPKTSRVLEVKGVSTKRHLEPTMMHLLRKHSRLTNIKVDLLPANSVSPNQLSHNFLYLKLIGHSIENCLR
jgi:hypothetical protein